MIWLVLCFLAFFFISMKIIKINDQLKWLKNSFKKTFCKMMLFLSNYLKGMTGTFFKLCQNFNKNDWNL